MTGVAHDPPARLVGAILVERGRMLLGLRASHRRSCPGCWDVIGGHVEAGESSIAALARELAEEIAVTSIRPVALRSLVIDDAVDGNVRLDLFLVHDWAGMPSIANDEHVDLRWFYPRDAARLPNLALPEYHAVFSDLRDLAAP